MLTFQASKSSPYHVCSGGVVMHKGLVLLLERDLEPDGKPGGHHLPKGTIMPDEPLEKAAVREIKEEAAAQTKPIFYLGALVNKYRFKGIQYDKTTHYFLCKYIGPTAQSMDGEHDRKGWYKLDEASKLLAKMPKGEEHIIARTKSFIDRYNKASNAK